MSITLQVGCQSVQIHGNYGSSGSSVLNTAVNLAHNTFPASEVTMEQLINSANDSISVGIGQYAKCEDELDSGIGRATNQGAVDFIARQVEEEESYEKHTIKKQRRKQWSPKSKKHVCQNPRPKNRQDLQITILGWLYPGFFLDI